MHEVARRLKFLAYSVGFGLRVFIKWILFGVLTGIFVGAIATAFYYALAFATDFRTDHPAIILALPLGGLLIAFLYQKFMKQDKGTNVVIAAIHKDEEIPLRVAPLIFVSTFLTQFFGASAGREGAALQLGGSLSAWLGRRLHLNKDDTHIIILCGMSAGFSAIFGTPLAAAIMPIEMMSVGTMQYSALVPCVLASLIAHSFAVCCGVESESFVVSEIPDLTILPFLQTLLLAICFGVLAAAFCLMLHETGNLLKKYFKNPYVRIVVTSLIIIGLTLLLQTTDYMGAGMDVVKESFEVTASPFAFLLKMIFTSLALGAGFKGGEIVPAFFVGATFGSFFGPLIGLPRALSAACGMIGVFCGVTNCPITALFIGFDLFGFEGMPYYLITIAVSYMMSGYHGLYKEQKIVFSKYQTKLINRHPK